MKLLRRRCFVNFFAAVGCLLIFCALLRYSEPPSKCPSHRWYGVLRGEKEQENGKGQRKAMVRVKQDVNNKQQYVNRSIIVWRAYGVGKGKTVTINSSRRGTFSCQNETFFACSFCKNKKESTLT